jgi:chromosome partitioning protein
MSVLETAARCEAPRPANAFPVVLAVVNPKGGCGKTTTAVSLAYAFSEQGYRTLLVDLDKQRSTTRFFGLEVGAAESIGAVLTRGTFLDLAGEQPDDARRVDSILVTGMAEQDGLDLLPSQKTAMARAEADLNNDTVNGNFRLREILAAGAGAYDMVVIDTPGNLNAMNVNALVAAGHALVVTQPAPGDIDEAIGMLDLIGGVQARFNPDLAVLGVALTNVPNPATNISEVMLGVVQRDIVDGLGVPIMRDQIVKDTKIVEAHGMRRPVGAAFPLSKGALRYKWMAQDIASRVGLAL